MFWPINDTFDNELKDNLYYYYIIIIASFVSGIRMNADESIMEINHI